MSTTSPCAIFNSARDSNAFLPVSLTNIRLSRKITGSALWYNLMINVVKSGNGNRECVPYGIRYYYRVITGRYS
jgi:hypothetical protein